MRSFILIPLIVGLLVAGCQDEPDPAVMRHIPFEPEGVLAFVNTDGRVLRQIAIEIAETDSARQRGLMERRSLSMRQGMLFIFPEADQRSFWMRNTPVPLDIIFVAPDSQVVNIVERTTPLSQESVESTGPAQFVVEVRAGFSDRFGLTDSTRIRWQPLPQES